MVNLRCPRTVHRRGNALRCPGCGTNSPACSRRSSASHCRRWWPRPHEQQLITTTLTRWIARINEITCPDALAEITVNGSEELTVNSVEASALPRGVEKLTVNSPEELTVNSDREWAATLAAAGRARSRKRARNGKRKR